MDIQTDSNSPVCLSHNALNNDSITNNHPVKTILKITPNCHTQDPQKNEQKPVTDDQFNASDIRMMKMIKSPDLCFRLNAL